MARNALIAVAETAEDVGAGLNKLLDPVADASAEIAALIAQCFSISAALRRLDEAVEVYEDHRRYDRIYLDIVNVRESLVYTFRDVQRLFGVDLGRVAIPTRAQYRQLWRDLTEHFRAESNNTLERRLQKYHDCLRDLRCILIEGRPPNVEQFEDLRIGIYNLLQVQEAASIVDDFDRVAIVPERPPSFERLRPGGDRPGPRRGPPRPMHFDNDDRYPRPPRNPGRHEDDDYYVRGHGVPFAPEVPDSPTGTFSSSSSGSRTVHDHWLPALFDQGQPPSTQFTPTGQGSIFLGDDLHPDLRRRLREEYDKLIELRFENGDLSVRFYYRPVDNKSRMLCRTLQPLRLRKDCCALLTDLKVDRSGPLLKFLDKHTREPWAILRFLTYEQLVLFFCSFLALRAEDTVNPVRSPIDADLHHEREFFAGRIIDDHYEHALRVFRDRDSGGIRLEASVLTGELERTPVWTAFITHQIQSPTWMTRSGSTVIHLADLHRYICNLEYRPQTSINGQHELNFVSSRDSRDFRHIIRELAEYAEY